MAIRIKEQSAWRSQILVTKALLRRELVTRFGKYKLGALWILVDPLLSVIVLGLILGPFLGRTTGEIPYPFFLLCGFMLLSMLTGTLNAGINAIPANQGLLVFRKVQPLDPFLARFIFQFLTITAAITVFCSIAYWLGVSISLARIPEVLLCIGITWALGSGLGLHLGIACMKFNELEKVVQYIQRPLIFLSAVFYPIDTIPPEARQYLLYNPLVHTIEIFRMALFPNYHAEQVNLYYPASWALLSCAIGMTLYRNNRHFLTQR